MKNLKVLLLVMLSVAAFNCSKKDKDNSPSTSGNLVGTWLEISEVENDVEQEKDPCSETITITDTTVSSKSGYGTDCSQSYVEDPEPYTRSGNTITVTSCYTPEGSTVEMCESDSVEIIELTDTTLKVKSVYTYDENGDGKEETYTVVFTYTRQ